MSNLKRENGLPNLPNGEWIAGRNMDKDADKVGRVYWSAGQVAQVCTGHEPFAVWGIYWFVPSQMPKNNPHTDFFTTTPGNAARIANNDIADKIIAAKKAEKKRKRIAKLRDKFAMAALQGMLAADCASGNEDLADGSYCVADAMLAQRKKGPT